jgi:hypothetical protein
MYINTIDDLIDRVIDNFSEVVSNNKIMKQVLVEQNFVKYQKDLNNIWKLFIDSISKDEIDKIVKKTDSKYTIYNAIKKYIVIYTFLLIAYYYKYDVGVYLNNIIEFTKNQMNYNFKVDDFFNSLSNALIIDNYNIIKNLLYFEKNNITTITPTEIKNLQNGDNFLHFFEQFDSDFIKSNFFTGDIKIKSYTIIKYIIVLSIYNINDRQEFFRLLEMTENDDGEFMFLDISIPTTYYKSYDSIVSLLNKDYIEKGMADKIWSYLKKNEDFEKMVDSTDEEYILELINTGIIVPIVDDFLLYHKETEKYEENNIKDLTTNKKEDTRVRYIINKIENVIDLYSDKLKENPEKILAVKKLFFTPLNNRKAILYNVIENIKIINKYINQDRKNSENIAYFNDLLNYTSYPYVNFKDFTNHGFTLNANKTIIAVRSVSFELSGEFKQNPRNRIQIRTFRKGTQMNIIGFLIPGTKRFYLCDKTEDVMSIRKNNKDINGIKVVGDYVRNTILGNNRQSYSQYWLFDPNIDKIEINTHDSTKKYNAVIKSLIATLYKNVKNEIYHKILDEIDKRKILTLQETEKIILNIEKKSIKNNENILNDIENKVYMENLIIDKEIYDLNDDKLYGLEGNVYTLKENPIKFIKKKQKIVVNIENKKNNNEIEIKNNNINGIDNIDIDDIDDNNDNDNDKNNGKIDIDINIIKNEGLCQHNITWINIMKKKKISHKEYMEDIYNFISKYVNETHDKRYTCKSCGFELGISRYLTDGSFDNETGRYISFGMQMEFALEDIPEYTKYNRSIKIIDKLIEKIGSIMNMTHIMGTHPNARWKRKSIVKNTIDLLELNNKRLEHNKFKERNIIADKEYFINRKMSNMFIFELDNSIFQYSSKDKDYYKPIKINNIVAYIIINIINDIRETQIQFIEPENKGVCSFESFEKYHSILFKELRLLINNKGDTVKCTDYKIFCYILYLISCKLAKRRIWNFENIDKSKIISDSLIPTIQNSIVNTVIDIMNSIMESSFEEKASYELEIYRYGFLSRINDFFKNNALYKMLYESYNNISSNDTKKTQLKNEPVVIKYDGPKKYKNEHKWNKCIQGKIFSKKTKKWSQINESINLNKFIYCDNGMFHKWSIKNGTFFCEKCNQRLDTTISVSESDEDNKKIIDNVKMNTLESLSEKFCPNGNTHKFLFDKNKQKFVCDICSKSKNSTYSKEELIEMNNNIRNKQIKNIKYSNKKINQTIRIENEYDKYSLQVIDNIEKNMKKNVNEANGKINYLVNFVKEMEKIIGSDKNVVNKSRLTNDSYVIDHNHLGYNLETPLVISDSDNKITFKKNHPFFKTDVIYYVNYKGNKIEVFYDAISKILLGYKEESKDYNIYKKGDVKLKIIYSIYNKILLLGVPSKTINMKQSYGEIVELYNNNNDNEKKNMYKHITKEIISERHANLKKIMFDLSRVINIITNDEDSKYTKKIEKEEDIIEETYFNDKIEVIISTYIKKINKMNTTDVNGKKKFMKHWNAVSHATKLPNIDNIDFNYSGDIIDIPKIISFDTTGNIMLYYIIQQLTNLIEYNDNKFIKINTVLFIIDFISYVYELFNIDYINESSEIMRFTYILNSSEYARDISEKNTVETNGVYEEVIDSNEYNFDNDNDNYDNEAKQDAEEEDEAIDMEGEIDYESGT